MCARKGQMGKGGATPQKAKDEELIALRNQGAHEPISQLILATMGTPPLGRRARPRLLVDTKVVLSELPWEACAEGNT